MAANQDKGTLLVVEDDVYLLQGIRDILELEGYCVLTAPSGVEGLEALNGMAAPPDLIISDIMMPRMDGYQFFEAVRARPEWIEVPFIFLTAKGEKTDIRRGKRLGADEYVVKPMDAEDLLVAIESKLRRRDQLRERAESQIADIKGNILTILNHEFRTPLTYVIAYADLLNRDAGELSIEDMRMFLRGLNVGAERLNRLVENFIILVELETGEAVQNYNWRRRTYREVLSVLSQVSAGMALFAEEKGATLRTDSPDAVPPFVADYEYLRIALSHLVENGIKFSDSPERTVELRATHDETHLRLSVQDWGRGIPEHELKNIWQSFYQVNRAQFEDQGAGAGLAIVRGIMDLHGGAVEVVSAPGEGSTFTLVLPLGEDAPTYMPGEFIA